MTESLNVSELLDAYPGAAMVADARGSLQSCNAAARELFDCDVPKMADIVLASKSDNWSIKRMVKEAAEEARLVTFSGVPSNGYARPITLVATPIIRNEKVRSVVCHVKTSSKRGRFDEIRRDFVANVSHELKTPITGIRLLAEALASTLSKAETDEDTLYLSRRLEMEAKRLANLVADLLDLSKLETGHTSKEAVSFTNVAREVSEQYRTAAADKGLELKTSFQSRCPKVWADTEQLELLAGNLVDNAIRYTTEGHVNVSVGAQNSNVIFTVADTGFGIPEADLPRIFERFYRVDKTRSRKTGGTGLGLSIVKHVLSNHKGRIDVQSEVGVGSVFTVKLPAYRR